VTAVAVSSKTCISGKTSHARTIAAHKQRIARQAKKMEQLEATIEREREEKERAQRLAQQLQQENELLTAQLEASKQQAATPNNLTLERFCNERGIANHTFGARMIALCVNLAKHLSFGAVPKVLGLVFEALGLEIKVPSHDSVKHWCKRVGLSHIKRLRKRYKDWLWIVDHSNQIGQEKVLVILGIPASQLPRDGQTLSLDQLQVLAIVPGKSWSRDDVREVYRKTAKAFGTPRYVVCDGAVELRDSVDVLKKNGKRVVVLRDFKHYAANRLESLVGRSENFKSFCKEMGLTRSRVQQTALAHLTPPSLKTKARFMNMGPIVRWAKLILFTFDNIDSELLREADRQLLVERFGWICAYRGDIEAWSRCCELIHHSLRWINTHCLTCGSGRKFQRYLNKQADWAEHELVGQLASTLMQFVKEAAGQLQHGERAWISSESLESLFGLFKRREGQHSRSGFTGLLVSLPTLMRYWSADEVRTALLSVKHQEVVRWEKETIGSTVTCRRAKAYRSMASAEKTAAQAA
jgi:hypothetical protein